MRLVEVDQRRWVARGGGGGGGELHMNDGITLASSDVCNRFSGKK